MRSKHDDTSESLHSDEAQEANRGHCSIVTTILNIHNFNLFITNQLQIRSYYLETGLNGYYRHDKDRERSNFILANARITTPLQKEKKLITWTNPQVVCTFELAKSSDFFNHRLTNATRSSYPNMNSKKRRNGSKVVITNGESSI
jgi:hypothetical protein